MKFGEKNFWELNAPEIAISKGDQGQGENNVDVRPPYSVALGILPPAYGKLIGCVFSSKISLSKLHYSPITLIFLPHVWSIKCRYIKKLII